MKYINLEFWFQNGYIVNNQTFSSLKTNKNHKKNKMKWQNNKPYFSCRPTEHRKTPPKATSSPKTQAVGSVLSAISIALFTAWQRFIFVVSPNERQNI